MELSVHGRAAYCHAAGTLDAGRPVIVLVHGALNDHSVWVAHARALARAGHAVLAPDLPGHGRSAGPALGSVEALADWLLALLDAAGAATAILAGHSMGSLIALEAAARAPRVAAALTLLGTACPMPVSEALLETARRDAPAAIGMIAAWSHAGFLPGPARLDPGCSTVQNARRLMERLVARAPGLLQADFAACDAYANGAAAAASVACPTLIVRGAQDMMTPPRAAAPLAGALAHARVVDVQAGHALMAQAPDEVLDALLGLAAEVLAARGGPERARAHGVAAAP